MVRLGLRALLLSLALAACAATAPRDEAVATAASSLAPAPAHYDLDATFRGGASIDAVVRITLPPDIANANPKFLLGKRFEVDVETSSAASITFGASDFAPGAGLVGIDFAEPAQAPVDIVFRYSGPLNPGGDHPYTAASDRRIELRLDTVWYPMIETINLPYTLDATFAGIPEGFVAVSQGDLTRDGDTLRIRRTLPDIDIPFIAAPDLARIEHEGTEVYAADPDWTVTALILEHAPKVADFYRGWFGPFPTEPVRIVVLSELSGAFARRGFIVLSDLHEHAAALGDMAELPVAKVVAHEFAHLWWAPADSRSEHRWLSESVAEYLSLRYIEAKLGLLPADQILDAKYPTAQAAAPVLGAGDGSGATLYQRGPALLFELERRIGREALDEVLARLGRDPPARTEQFLAVLADVAGAQAAADFETQLRSGPGPWKEHPFVEG